MNLQSTDFELFGVPQRFEQDANVLDQRWKDLQRQAHPDRFTAQGAVAQRLAMQWSVRINEAYQRLKDPLRRAAYLCELHHAAIQADKNTAMPTAFLMQQMQWREALEEARSEADLQPLEQELSKTRQTLLQECQQLIDIAQDFMAAAQKVRALMFIERFGHDIQAKFDQLGQ